MARPKRKIMDAWERQAWSPPPEETIDQWAERSIVLPRGVSAIAGPLTLELTPYLREPLRAVIDPDTEEIVLCTSSQVGKTTFLVIAVLYYIANDPWNVFHIMPTEDEALEVKHERYIPIIKESPALAGLLDPKPRGQLAGDTIRLNGCTVTFRGSRSASGLASKPAKIAIADEIDKWESWTGAEADPLDLLGERLKTFHDAKFLKVSTPTTKDGRIYRDLEISTDERYFVPCPICGHYQVLVFGDGTAGAPGLKWPSKLTAAEIDRGNLAWYECEHCQGRIDEKHKRQMVMGGVWAPKEAKLNLAGKADKKITDKRRRGFHLWAAYSLWPRASWSKIAAKFLESKDAASSLMNFRNSWLADVWHVTLNELGAAHLRERVKPYHQGEVPAGPWTCTVGVDVQQTGSQVYQYYVIRAWGAEGESWLVRCGMVPDWQALYAVLFDSVYRDVNGSRLPTEVVIIDSGFRTDEVYQFCDLYGLWAAKGDSRSRRPYAITETESAQGSGRWIRRLNLNPDYFKGQLHHRIQSGKWHLPEDVPEEYFQQMTAEQVVVDVDKRTGRSRHSWKVVTPGRPNHYFDCEVLALCGAEVLELQWRQARPAAAEESEPSTRRYHAIKSRVFS
jgi:phage terminase large subunit GpA-like protein